MDKFYKVAITNIYMGKPLGPSVLCQNFSSVQSALEEAATHSFGERTVVEVREYDANENSIVAFGNPADTGATVYLNDDFKQEDAA